MVIKNMWKIFKAGVLRVDFESIHIFIFKKMNLRKIYDWN